MALGGIVSTTCLFCGVGCGLELHIHGNQILRATTLCNHPVSRGNLCVKGRFGWDFVYHPNRVLKRLSARRPNAPVIAQKRALRRF